MGRPITQLEVSINQAEEQNLMNRGFRKINVNLNKGTGGNEIFLWFKAEEGDAPITRVQVSFNEAMAEGMINTGFQKIDKNLNAGNIDCPVFLWFFKGTTENDFPIVEVSVTTNSQNEATKFRHGWDRVPCDVNRGPVGDWIHIWLKRFRTTYIKDIRVTDSYGSDSDLFQDGFIRLDESTNRGGCGDVVFLWYSLTSNKDDAITDVKISRNDTEFQLYQNQEYTSVGVNLNEGNSGNPVYLWFKQVPHVNPVKRLTVLLNESAVKDYQKAGIVVIDSGNSGFPLYLCTTK